LNESTCAKSLVLALDDALRCALDMQVEWEMRAPSCGRGLS